MISDFETDKSETGDSNAHETAASDDTASPPEQRSDDRLPVLWEGMLETEEGEEFPCAVRDISRAGALVTTDLAPPLGVDLMLTIDGLGEFAGMVKWVGSGDIGLMLLAGPDLELKRFAEASGADLSLEPQDIGDDPFALDDE